MRNENEQSKYSGNPLNEYAQFELMEWIGVESECILDLGCGDGKTTREIKRLFPKANVYGLTANEEEARENSTDQLKILYGDAHELPFEDGFFDTIFARHILEHCIAPLTVLKELNRILKISGKLVISVPSVEEDWILNMEDHYSVLPKKMWKKLFGDSGFDILKEEDGTWLAYFSMKDEKEYRFFLEKAKDLTSSEKNIKIYKPQVDVYNEPPLEESLSPIAFVINNFVSYDTLKPLMEKLRKENVGYDILIPVTDDSNAKQMFEDTFKKIQLLESNVKMVDSELKEQYLISFYPFLPFYFNIKSKYTVRYQYGIGKPTYNFDTWSLNFDYILCASDYDQSYLENYTQTVLVGPLKFANYKGYKKTEKKSKLNILYMPTYGDLSSIKDYLETFKELKNEYNISIKIHHMTTYYEKETVVQIEEIFAENEIFNHLDAAYDVFNGIDLIISDGSGAIFDAIATSIQVVILDPQKIPSIDLRDSFESNLITSNKVKSASSPLELKTVIAEIAESLESLKSENEILRKELFPIIGSESVEKAWELVDNLLNDCVNKKALLIQRKIRKTFYDFQEKNKFQENFNNNLIESHKKQRDQILKIIEERDMRIKELSNLLNQYIKFDQEKVLVIEEQKKEIQFKDEIIFELKNQLNVNNNLKELSLSRQLIDNITAKEKIILENRNKVNELEKNILLLKTELESIKNSKIYKLLKRVKGD